MHLQSAITQSSPNRMEPQMPAAMCAPQGYASGPSRGVTPMTPMSCLLMSALLPGRPPSSFPVRPFHEGPWLSPPFQQVHEHVLASLLLGRAGSWHWWRSTVLSIKSVHLQIYLAHMLAVLFTARLQLWRLPSAICHLPSAICHRHSGADRQTL